MVGEGGKGTEHSESVGACSATNLKYCLSGQPILAEVSRADHLLEIRSMVRFAN